MSMGAIARDQDKTTQAVLEVMQQLLGELHPSESGTIRITLDSSLEADLRLDSLARMELISRLEQHFNIALPQRVFIDAETPRDLLRAIISARGRETARVPLSVREVAQAPVENLPHSATTLLEVLEWHVKQHPQRLHIRILDEDGNEDNLTYEQLWQGAQRIAAGLQQLAIQPSDTVAIMLPTGREYFYCFFGVLISGAVPVPIYPPVRRSQLEEHLRRHGGILNNCEARILITVAEAKGVARLLRSLVPSLRAIVTPTDVAVSSEQHLIPVIGPHDVAFIQYTSGSTGNPKGVVLTHSNLLANIRVMGEVIKADSNDVFVSWLPLYHDMGLIGAWLGSLYFSVLLIVMSPVSFLTRPQRWLWTIHQYRGTLSAAPNFGYELILKRISNEDLQGLDLSSWRLAFNGAEPVSPDTITRFQSRFKAAGVKPHIIMPVYGLAEASVGLAFPPLDRGPLIDCVQREQLERSGSARPARQDDKTALCFVACGQPLPGHEIRIIDSDGRELPERQEGYLQFRGPSVTSGYFHNPEASKKLFYGNWLDSGDLAYIAAGDIYITGRRKDVIIRAGRNIYPHELEEAIGNIDGVRKGCVVAFGSIEQRTGTERLVILAETREMEEAGKQRLQQDIVSLASDLIDMPPDEVIMVPPHTVLKTSSGKIRRSACRELYEHGQLGQATKAFWLQLLHMLSGAVLPEWRRLRNRGLASLYAGYCWLLFGVVSSVSWVFVMILPGVNLRWKALHYFSRLLAFGSGTRLTVNGLENLLPQGQTCVFVANHASYLDSYALTAAIPRSFAYVAKIELGKDILLGPVLRRLGVAFVKRFDKTHGTIDSQHLLQMARQKQSLVFFPEGTFSRIPGLMDFHMGAFVTAAQADIPVVPVAIRGTRSILRSDSWFPRHGQITVTIGPAISKAQATESDKQDEWKTALKLRDMAYKHILRHCGEPALSILAHIP